MGYCDQADLVTRIGNDRMVQLTSDTGSSIDSTVVIAAIERASAKMDADLSSRYAVPVVTTGDAPLAATLRTIAVDLTEYYLYQRREGTEGAKQSLYDNAVKWLEDIRSGEHPLPATEGTPASTESSPPASVFGFSTR